MTELVVAQLMYLEWMNSKEPVYIYINSTGTARDDGEPVSKIIRLVTSVKYLGVSTGRMWPIHVFLTGVDYKASLAFVSCVMVAI